MKKIYILLLILFSTASFAISTDEFCELCKTNNLKKIQSESHNVEINITSSKGSTPLINAVVSGNKDVVLFLLNKGADPNLPDSEGQTPLLSAISLYKYDIIKTLIEKGGDVNKCDKYGSSPLLHFVINSQDLSILNTNFIDKDSNDKQKKEIKFTKKEEADIQNKTDILNFLIKSGADMNFSNNEGISPVLQTIMDNNLYVFDIFVRNGFDINSYIGIQNTTALNQSIIRNNDIFSYLLKLGADTEKTDISGISPVYLAIVSDNLKFVETLTEKRDINAPINFENDKEINEACKLGKEKIVKYLVEKGADLNVKDKYGFTPVHDSVLYENILKMILDKNPKIDFKNNDLDTPLHLAAKYNKLESVKMLIEKGATQSLNIDNKIPLELTKNDEIKSLLKDISVTYEIPSVFSKISDKNITETELLEMINQKDDYNNNVLYYTVHLNNYELSEFFIKKGCDVNNKNTAGLSPIFNSVQNNNADLTNLLIEKGANIQEENIRKETPLMLAIKNEAFEMTKLLTEKGADINHTDTDNIPVISKAFFTGNIDICNYLLSLNPNLNIKDANEKEPIYYLLSSDKKENIEIILNKYLEMGGETDFLTSLRETPLHVATEKNLNKNILDKLVNENNINLKGPIPPIAYAVMKGNLENSKFLFEKGSKYFNDKSINLLTLSLMYNYNKDLFMYLLDKESNLNVLTNKGTPLSVAINQNNTEATLLLLEKGADPNIKINNSYAIFKGLHQKNIEIVNNLLKYNCNVNVTETGKITPLMIAVKEFDFDITEKIINLSDDVNAVNSQGLTALHLAVFNKGKDKEKIIKLLVEKGADINAKSNLGLTPIHNAIGINDIETVKYLKDKGAEIVPTKIQLDGYELARDRGYKDILELYGKKLPELKNGELYDTCNYKLKITKVTPNIYNEVVKLINMHFINGIIDITYSNETVYVNYDSPYVIGEMTQIFTKIENSAFKFYRIKDDDKTIDLCAEIRYN